MFQFRTIRQWLDKEDKGRQKQFGYCHLFFSFSSVYFQRDKNIYTEGQAWLTEKTQKRPVCFSLIQAWIRSFSSGTVERGEKKYTESALYSLTIKKKRQATECIWQQDWKRQSLKSCVWLVPGSSMLSVRGCLLKGSVGEFRRCRRMMDRSMMLPDGSCTGSVIRVSISGSVQVGPHCYLRTPID